LNLVSISSMTWVFSGVGILTPPFASIYIAWSVLMTTERDLGA